MALLPIFCVVIGVLTPGFLALSFPVGRDNIVLDDDSMRPVGEIPSGKESGELDHASPEEGPRPFLRNQRNSKEEDVDDFVSKEHPETLGDLVNAHEGNNHETQDEEDDIKRGIEIEPNDQKLETLAEDKQDQDPEKELNSAYGSLELHDYDDDSGDNNESEYDDDEEDSDEFDSGYSFEGSPEEVNGASESNSTESEEIYEIGSDV